MVGYGRDCGKKGCKMIAKCTVVSCMKFSVFRQIKRCWISPNFLSNPYHSQICLPFRAVGRSENWEGGVKVIRSRKKICRAVTSPKKRTNEFVFLSWRLGNTWNLNFDFDLGEVSARQFCFEIYWPLTCPIGWDRVTDQTKFGGPCDPPALGSRQPCPWKWNRNLIWFFRYSKPGEFLL